MILEKTELNEKKTCLDCKHCFIEDLYHEMCCGHPKRYHFYVENKEICDDFEGIGLNEKVN